MPLELSWRRRLHRRSAARPTARRGQSARPAAAPTGLLAHCRGDPRSIRRQLERRKTRHLTLLRAATAAPGVLALPGHPRQRAGSRQGSSAREFEAPVFPGCALPGRHRAGGTPVGAILPLRVARRDEGQRSPYHARASVPAHKVADRTRSVGPVGAVRGTRPSVSSPPPPRRPAFDRHAHRGRSAGVLRRVRDSRKCCGRRCGARRGSVPLRSSARSVRGGMSRVRLAS